MITSETVNSIVSPYKQVKDLDDNSPIDTQILELALDLQAAERQLLKEAEHLKQSLETVISKLPSSWMTTSSREGAEGETDILPCTKEIITD